jgi:uncharacterized protein
MVDSSHRFISVDDHVQEHPRVWTDRLSSQQWGDRIPHVVSGADGREQWIVDGKPLDRPGVAEVGALLADRADVPQRWDEVPAAAYVPGERLKAMDAARIQYSVLYPSVVGVAGEILARIEDPELELACVQAYNDWLIDEWAAASDRLVPQCIVPISSPERTAAEIRRAVGRGHRGVVFPALPMELREVPHVNDPDYDVVWATCQELGVPLCLHAGSAPRYQLPAHESLSPRLSSALGRVLRSATPIFEVSNLLFSRILNRHPDLQVVFAESALGWATFMLEVADNQFTQDRVYLEEGYELKPSELFHRQCFFTGWYDAVADCAPHLGVGNILWAANFPQATSTWPDCQSFIARSFEGMSETDRQRILWDNAAALYGIKSRELATVS